MQMLVKATLGSGENACENILQTMMGMDNVPNLHLGRLQHHQQLICMLLSDSDITWLTDENSLPFLRIWSLAFQLRSWVCSDDGHQPTGLALVKATEEADCYISTGLYHMIFSLPEGLSFPYPPSN